MTLFREYHKPMRPLISAPVAQLSSLAVALLLALPAVAQVNGPPASVTSPGFGGHPVNGPRSSVTSVGPRGYAPQQHHGKTADGKHGQQKDNAAVGPEWYAIPVPYAVDNGAVGDQPAEGEDPVADPQAGPTGPDRHGPGPLAAPPAKSIPSAHPAEYAEEAPTVDDDPPLPPTLLVFKDGRTLEVANYAIQGQTVYDLTPGHRRKIALMDLDLEATRKQNDERGVTFQLPQGTHVN